MAGEVIAALRYVEKLSYVLPVSGCDKGWYLKRARVSLLLGVRSHRSVIDLEATTCPPLVMTRAGLLACPDATPFSSRVVGPPAHHVYCEC
jgi:hypothetical protein